MLEPEEVLKAVKQAEEATTPTAGESKGRFKRLGLNFGNKDRNLRKSSFKETCSEISPRQQFSNFFDGKSSLFSKKPPKPESASSGDRTPSSDENDWTIVNP